MWWPGCVKCGGQAVFKCGGQAEGGLHPKPPKFEHIFVAVITFPPFLLCRYF